MPLLFICWLIKQIVILPVVYDWPADLLSELLLIFCIICKAAYVSIFTNHQSSQTPTLQCLLTWLLIGYQICTAVIFLLVSFIEFVWYIVLIIFRIIIQSHYPVTPGATSVQEVYYLTRASASSVKFHTSHDSCGS